MDEIEGPHRNVATNGAVRKGSAPKKPVGEPSVYSAARMGIYHRCMVNPPNVDGFTRSEKRPI